MSNSEKVVFDVELRVRMSRLLTREDYVRLGKWLSSHGDDHVTFGEALEQLMRARLEESVCVVFGRPDIEYRDIRVWDAEGHILHEMELEAMTWLDEAIEEYDDGIQ